jgi:hypothetical protein
MGESLLFASVTAVAEHARPDIAGLPHVLATIDACMGVAECWTVTHACALGSFRLLQCIVKPIAAYRHKLSEDELLFQRAQFRRGMEIAAARGDLAVIQLLVTELMPDAPITTAIREAARCGHMHVLQWLADNCAGRIQWTSEEWFAAAAAGHMDVLEWLFRTTSKAEHEGSVDYARLAGELVEISARRGDLPLLQWLCMVVQSSSTTPMKCPTSAIAFAAAGGHLEVAKLITQHGLLRSNIPIRMDEAAANGHLHVLEYFNATGKGYFLKRTTDEAARNGQLHVVQWLHANRREGCTKLAMDSAAANGHLATVQWLHENRREGCTTAAMDSAAANGHLQVVEWLHASRGEGCTPAAMDGAAANGHLDILEWLHTHRSEGCTAFAMAKAASGNHLEVMQWLHAHYFDRLFSPSAKFDYAPALCEAAANGHVRVLQWFHEANLPDQRSWTRYVMDNAAGNGHLETVKWLHANRRDGCTANAMDWAAGNGHLEVAQWLHANRGEGCTMSAMDDAAGRAHLEVVQWLHLNRKEGCTVRAMDDAAGAGHLEVLRFLRRERERRAAARARLSRRPRPATSRCCSGCGASTRRSSRASRACRGWRGWRTARSTARTAATRSSIAGWRRSRGFS